MKVLGPPIVFIAVQKEVQDDCQSYRAEEKHKLQSWYEDIEERKSRNMSVDDWCKYRFYSKSTYYYRQHKVHQALDAQLNKQETQIEFAALPAPLETKLANNSGEKIVLRMGELILEIPDGTSRETILALLAGIKC